MFKFGTNSAKVKKFHRLSGRLSAFCWWATILMFLIHMGFCFEKPQVGDDVMYPDSLVKSPVIIVTIAFLYWLVLSALYFLFGRAILIRNLKQMTMVTFAANAARRETPEQATALDDKLIAAWTGHPHLRVIDNSTNFEDKLKRLLREILPFLGEPEPLEIERKYLIEYPDMKWLAA